MTPALALSSGRRAWTPVEVRRRLIEAFEIERRIPSRRVGNASWPAPVVHTFADVVGWSDASERIWEQWDRGRGASPDEVSRWEQTIGWLQILADHRDEQEALTSWAILRARHRPLTIVLRRRAWSRATFYRLAARGSRRIASYLNEVAMIER